MSHFTLPGKWIMAPMAGVTDPVFRALCVRFGAAMTVTEMVSAKGLSFANENTGDLLEPCGAGMEAAQIFGHEPELMASQLSNKLFDPFQVIDINMGCPAKKIVSNHEGSALLNDPGLAAEILSACVQATKKPVTVKMRIGWENFSVLPLAKAAERAGVAAITIHGRTTLQGYSGRADLNAIRAIRDAVSLPLIGNGDVCDGPSAEKMLATGCDAVMIGRGAQGRPWIFSEINAYFDGTPFTLSRAEKLEIAREHGYKLAALRGERTAMLQMRKHIAWYTHGMRGAAVLRAGMNAIETLTEMDVLLNRLISWDRS